MSYVIINDLHLGLTRRTGATPESLKAFNAFQFDVFREIVQTVNFEDTLIILGDLFHGPDVGYDTLWSAYEILNCVRGDIVLVRGNHDNNKDLTKTSAFDMLGKLLPSTMVISAPYKFSAEMTIIPHLPTQKMFDEAVAEAAEKSSILLFHANFDCGFAVNSDHSLNLSPEQAAMFNLCIGGHEHNARNVRNVRMLGSQLPCNIQEAEREKFYHTWDGEGDPVPVHAPVEFVYDEIDWHDLNPVQENMTANFVRVIGGANPEEAATVIQEVAAFREDSSAFFVSNSVKIGELDMGEIEEAAEDSLHIFNPRTELMLCLPQHYRDKMEAFLK